MISIPSITEIKAFDHNVQSIDLSLQDFAQEEDGTVFNFQSGNKCKALAKKSREISLQLPKRSKSDSSMKIKESLQPLNTSDMPNKFLAGTEKKKIEYDSAKDWEIGLDSLYNEDDVISILNIVSCMENKRRGFGNRNDDECYWEERKADKDNRLYEEAIYGLELLERGRLRRLKRVRSWVYGNT